MIAASMRPTSRGSRPMADPRPCGSRRRVTLVEEAGGRLTDRTVGGPVTRTVGSSRTHACAFSCWCRWTTRDAGLIEGCSSLGLSRCL